MLTSRIAPTASTNRNNYPAMEGSSLREISVKSVKNRSLHFVAFIASKIDHISEILTNFDQISDIFHCMKSHSVRD